MDPAVKNRYPNQGLDLVEGTSRFSELLAASVDIFGLAGMLSVLRLPLRSGSSASAAQKVETNVNRSENP